MNLFDSTPISYIEYTYHIGYGNLKALVPESVVKYTKKLEKMNIGSAVAGVIFTIMKNDILLNFSTN